MTPHDPDDPTWDDWHRSTYGALTLLTGLVLTYATWLRDVGRGWIGGAR
jgi:hypothetical protein